MKVDPTEVIFVHHEDNKDDVTKGRCKYYPDKYKGQTVISVRHRYVSDGEFFAIRRNSKLMNRHEQKCRECGVYMTNRHKNDRRKERPKITSTAILRGKKVDENEDNDKD